MKWFEASSEGHSKSNSLAGGAVPGYGTGVGPGGAYQQPYPGTK